MGRVKKPRGGKEYNPDYESTEGGRRDWRAGTAFHGRLKGGS